MLDHKDCLTSLEDLKRLRLNKRYLEEEIKLNNEGIEILVRDLVEYMETTDQLSIKIKNIGMCSLTNTKHYSIDKDDPMAAEAFEGWMRQKGDWDLVLIPHYKKVHGYYAERLDLNEELPPGVKTFIKQNITIRG